MRTDRAHLTEGLMLFAVHDRLFLVGSSSACSDLPTTLLWHVSEVNIFSPVLGLHPVHGARYFITPTQKLCVKTETGSGNPSIVAWAGFRPYV